MGVHVDPQYATVLPRRKIQKKHFRHASEPSNNSVEMPEDGKLRRVHSFQSYGSYPPNDRLHKISYTPETIFDYLYY